MNKLKIKIFMIIFTILTIFLLGVFIINISREYNIQRNNISNILNRDFQNMRNSIKKMPDDRPREIFINYTIYNIMLDKDGNYLEVINAMNIDDFDEDKIIRVVNKIMKSNKKNSISNLIFNNYSYIFNSDKVLTLMDNSVQTNKMQRYILTSLLYLFGLEIMAYVVAMFLSKWVTDPVKESFEREKRFIADASHELKTPICVIMASVDAYNKDKDNKWIANITSESERMGKLVKNLLDLTKLENNKELIKKEQNLSKIIEGSLLTFESLFYENQLKLEYHIDDKISYNCNQDSIRELMGILVDNAIKYSYLKGKVIVNLYKEQKDIILEVKNKGIPIDDEDKEKIFERFYKVDKSRTRKSDNYGLGLSIAKRIVELHEGTISASSGDGLTTFKVVWSQK